MPSNRPSAADAVGANGGAAAYAIGPMRSHKLLLARFVATSLGRSLFAMATVLLIQQFLAGVVQNKEGVGATVSAGLGAEGALFAIGALLIGSYVGSSLFYYDNQVVRQRIVKIVELALMERLIRHLLSLSVSFFDRASHGDLLHAVRQDVANLRLIVLSYATIAMESAVAIGLAASAVWISPRLAFWVFFVVPVAALPIVAIARRTRRRSFAERTLGYVVFDMILQLLRGIRIIKIFHAEEDEARTTLDQAQRYFDEQIRVVRIRELSTVLLESLAGLSIAAIVIVGGVGVMHGTLQWPQLLAFLIAVRSLHGPLDHINANYMEVQHNSAAAERITHLLAERPEVREAPDALPLRSAPHSIALDDVSFSYGDGEVLHGISLETHRGETIGIAGPSGSGKTTLLGLVARFFDPISGAIRFDGRDLRGIPLQHVYRQVAMVTQEPFVFATTARENIRCGSPGASDEAVEAAARVAEVHDEILALPLGYDTLLGTSGRTLSGGQAQRINVARAVLKNAPILLLDEATSSLDSIAEAKVQHALDRLMAGRTSFIVAHRLSTLRHADRILVLDRGTCVGLGSHDALLRDCPLYRLMWETQLLGDASAREVPLAAAGDAERQVVADESSPAAAADLLRRAAARR